MRVVFNLPVHDDPVWDVDALYVLVVVLRVGEQVQTVSWPVIFDLPVRQRFLNGSGPSTLGTFDLN